jgi:hypothetical protein
MLWDNGTVQDPRTVTVVVFEYVMLALMVELALAIMPPMPPDTEPPTVPLKVVPDAAEMLNVIPD